MTTETKTEEIFGEVPVSIKLEGVQSLLVSAIEGGSNYWYHEMHYRLPEGIVIEDFEPGGRFTDPKNYFHPLEIIPFVEGCCLTLEVHEHADGEDFSNLTLNREKMLNGLKLMANDQTYAHHFADFIKENADQITADVWFQFCVFGKVIFS